MAGFVTSIFNSISRGFVFAQITRFINPELLSSLIYFTILIFARFFDYSFLEDFSKYILVELVMMHANIGIAAAIFFSSSERNKKILLIIMGLSYSVFVIVLAFAFGAWWMAFVFVLIIYSRMITPLKDLKKVNWVGEMVLTMVRFGFYMLAGLLCILLNEYAFGEEHALGMLVWGATYYMAIYLLRNKESMIKNFFGNESDYIMPEEMYKSFENERIWLRLITFQDVNFIRTIVNTEGWLQYIGDRNVHNELDAENFIQTWAQDRYKTLGYGPFIIQLKSTDEIVGICGLFKRDHLEYPDLGFALLPDFYGQGLAQEASKLVIKYAFEKLKLPKLYAITAANNTSSTKLLHKLGFIEISSPIDSPDKTFELLH